MRLVVAALAEPVAGLGRQRGLAGPDVAAMPSTFGGTTEIQKEIIARNLGL